MVEIVVRTHAAVARPWIGRTAQWAMGTVLIGLGARVALTQDHGPGYRGPDARPQIARSPLTVRTTFPVFWWVSTYR